MAPSRLVVPAPTAKSRSTAPLLLVLGSVGLALGCSGGGSAGPGPEFDPTLLVDSVVVSADSTDVVIGDTVRIVATAVDAAGNPVPGIKFAWTTSDASVASVTQEGLVTGVGFGEADIDVTVTGPAASGAAAAAARGGKGTRSRNHIVSIPNISISPSKTTTDLAKPVSFHAAVTDAAGKPLLNLIPRWRSSALGVATIDIAGLATPIGPGTTTISATLVSSVSGQSLRTATAQLTVAICEGLFDVPSWDVSNVARQFSVPTESVQGNTVTVDETSTGTATLTHRTSYGNDSTTWFGAVTGTAHINNKAVGPPDQNGVKQTLTDIGNGPQVAAPYVRLKAFWNSTINQCKFVIQYGDGVTFVDTDDTPVTGGSFSVTEPFGVTLWEAVTGPKPASGWQLSASGPVLVVYDDQDLSTLGSYFTPLTSIPNGLLLLTPQVLRQAHFAFSLTAH